MTFSIFQSIMTRKKSMIIICFIFVLENLIELTGSVSAYYPEDNSVHTGFGKCFNVPKTQLFPKIYGYYVFISKVCEKNSYSTYVVGYLLSHKTFKPQQQQVPHTPIISKLLFGFS